jgi:hypothetical protein
MTSSLLTVIVLTLSAPAPVRHGPVGPPPRVMIAKIEADGQPYIFTAVLENKRVTRTVTEMNMGRLEQRTETITVPVTYYLKVALNDNDAKVYAADGKRIAPEDVQQLIPNDSPVLVSSNGDPVDPIYLRLLGKGAVVVVSPRLVAPTAEPVPRSMHVSPEQ